MNDETKNETRPSPTAEQAAHPRERAAFKTLLLANPNYFGNLAESSFQSILPISGNTFYEQLACVGYQPQQERLEAVVYVFQPSGYGSDVCGPRHARVRALLSLLRRRRDLAGSGADQLPGL